MATNTYIIDLNINDTLQDVIRKSNANFRKIVSDSSNDTSSSIRRESTSTDSKIERAIDNAIGEINVAIENGLNKIDAKFEALLEEANKKIDDIDTTPPVGTYIMCDYAPSTQWSGTTWNKVTTEENISLPIWKRVK